MKPVQKNNQVRQSLKNRRLSCTLEVVFTDSSGEVIYYPSVVRYQVWWGDQGRVVEGEFNAHNGGTFQKPLAPLYSQDHLI